jgi:hypothetical protein
MQTDFSISRILFVSAFILVTFKMHSIRNVLTKKVLKNSLGDQGTWLLVRPAITYVYTLHRPSIVEHLAHSIT